MFLRTCWRYCCISLVIFGSLGWLSSAQAAIAVVASYGWIGNLVQQIGQDRVDVQVLAQASFDPHFVPPKPSLAVKLRRADLLVINGAQLEIGWLPPVLSQSANARIQPGQPGFLDLSTLVQLSHVRTQVSRAEGDVHPDGNPHYVFDPDNMPLLAQGIAQQLCQLDHEGCAIYAQTLQDFKQKWAVAQMGWLQALRPLKDTSVVQYHESFDALAHWAGFHIVANIEPVPGIPPSAHQLETLLKQLDQWSVRRIIQEHFRDTTAAKWLIERHPASLVILPADVGADDESSDVFRWFDVMVKRLVHE